MNTKQVITARDIIELTLAGRLVFKLTWFFFFSFHYKHNREQNYKQKHKHDVQAPQLHVTKNKLHVASCALRDLEESYNLVFLSTCLQLKFQNGIYFMQTCTIINKSFILPQSFVFELKTGQIKCSFFVWISMSGQLDMGRNSFHMNKRAKKPLDENNPVCT